MQTKQSVTNSNILIAAFGLLWMLLPVSQSAQAQDIPSRDSAPVVFQAAGVTTDSIQSSVNAFRAALGVPNNGNTPGPLKNGRREIDWDGGYPNVMDTTAPATPFYACLNSRRRQLNT